jgi:hypothetical protein
MNKLLGVQLRDRRATAHNCTGVQHCGHGERSAENCGFLALTDGSDAPSQELTRVMPAIWIRQPQIAFQAGPENRTLATGQRYRQLALSTVVGQLKYMPRLARGTGVRSFQEDDVERES